MGSIHVKLHGGQEFDYVDADNGVQFYELVDTTYNYEIITVRRVPHQQDMKSTKRQFPKRDVANIRRL